MPQSSLCWGTCVPLALAAHCRAQGWAAFSVGHCSLRVPPQHLHPLQQLETCKTYFRGGLRARTPGISTCLAPPQALSEPGREIVSGLGDTQAGAEAFRVSPAWTTHLNKNFGMIWQPGS